MNILLIPSWYPNGDYFMNGIFIKEQVYALAELYPEINIGVSLWGQQLNSCLLWVKDHFHNLEKIRSFYHCPKSTNIRFPKPNLAEIETPTLTWSTVVLNGNFKRIIQAHQKNVAAFEELMGPTHLIHAQVSHKAGIIAYELSKTLGIPYIITEQMSPFPFPAILGEKDKLKANYKSAFDHARLNIAISPDLMDKMDGFQIPNLRFIPNLVDEEFFTLPTLKKKNQPFIFFTLCEMREQKDIPTLLKAIAILKTQQVEANFRIGGFGEEMNKNQQLAYDLKIRDRIKWLGPLDREQAREEYQNAHAFVLASKHETFGVVFAEAIACGLPIIATRCGGPECIVTAENGLLVEVGKPNQLADAMVSLMRNYEKYQPESIRKSFMDRFSKKVVCSQLMRAYRGVLEG